MSRRRLVLILVVAAAFFGWAQAARAATITVNTTADNGPTAGVCNGQPSDCSLRQAISVAGSGDEIHVPAGTYTLTLPSTASGGGALRITKNLTIVGQGTGPGDVVITASYPTFDDRLMTVSGIDVPPAVVLQNLTLNGGKTSSANDVNSGGGAAIWLASGNLTLDSVVLSQNHAKFGAADADGGAIDDTGGNLTLNDVTASSNVGANGGAIADTGGSLTFNNTTFTGNDAVFGGGIYLDISDQSATGVASTFYANALSAGGGGGIMIESGGVSLTNSTFMGNGAGTIPGGGIDNHGGHLALTNVTLDHNFGSNLNTDDAVTTMHNTIIGSGGCSGIGLIQSSGNNIFPSGTCNVNETDSDLIDGVPGLAVLANNGGPTMTEALLSNSDAIGAGSSCPSEDQRHMLRSQTCDIGAYAAGPQFAGTAGDSVTATFFANVSLRSCPETATIDWGDGSGPVSASVSCGPSSDFLPITVTGSHVYATAGYYQLTAESDDGSQFAGSAQVAAAPGLLMVNTTSDLAPIDGECSGSPDVPCSLRQAVDLANQDADGDTVVLSTGVYALTLGSSLQVDAPMTISGVGAGSTTIDGSSNVDGQNNLNRIMKITAAGTLSIKDLTMTGGVDDNDEVTGSAIPTVSLNGGGAIFNDGGTLVLQRVVLTGNAANNPIGGAIANSGGSLGMTDVTFSQNSAAVGGALRIRSGTVTGTGVTFAGNYGEFGGGSVYIDGGSLLLVNSTLDGSAGLDGYGIGVQNAGGTVSLLNDTISASQGYALETDRGASTTVENTIIGQGGRGDCVPANGSDSVDDGTTVAAVTVDVGNNVDQTGDCHLDGSGDQTGDPGIAPLADNGGPTKTDALLVDSPAIDSGNGDGCPDTDQRGVSRSSECDIGAYAAQFLGGPSATTSDAQVNGPNDATLSATVDTAGEGGAYAFEWGTTPNLGNETPLLAAGIASGQTVQADLPGLAPAQTYYFSAVAENASGRSQDEQILSFTTSAATPTVSDVTVSDVFDTTVTVGGTVDPGGDATSYWIEYGPTADLGSQTAATPIGSTPGEQSVQQALTGLDPGTLYYARIVATNPEGTTDGTTTTFTTGPQFAATSGVLLTADLGSASSGGCPAAGRFSIDWGDGSALGTAAGVTCSPGTDDQTDFTVSGSHTYGSPGHYDILVTETDANLTFGDGALVSSPSTTTTTSPPPPPSLSPPTVGIPSVAVATATSAVVSASVDPNGSPTFYHVEYGPTAAYGQQTGAVSAGSGTSAQAVSVTLSGLSPGTTYHVRVVATNPAGTTASSDATFTTTATGPPPPVQGQSLDVAPFSGNVLVNGQPLTVGEQIPFGSTIDARNGTITLVSIGPTGQLQSASFTGAIFQVVQAADGSTELILQGGDFSVCKNTQVRRTAGLEAKPKPKPKPKSKAKNGRRTPPKVNTTVVRSLWGNGTGQFTTKGRYAAATVRGTVWHTSDRCDGTSVEARTGVVAVLDLVTGKTIILTAPATYLAHP